jgi:hypothetical protein
MESHSLAPNRRVDDERRRRRQRSMHGGPRNG